METALAPEVDHAGGAALDVAGGAGGQDRQTIGEQGSKRAAQEDVQMVGDIRRMVAKAGATQEVAGAQPTETAVALALQMDATLGEGDWISGTEGGWISRTEGAWDSTAGGAWDSTAGGAWDSTAGGWALVVALGSVDSVVLGSGNSGVLGSRETGVLGRELA